METNSPPSSAQDLSLNAASVDTTAALPVDSLEAVQLERPLDEARPQEIVVVTRRRNPWLLWGSVGLLVCLVLGGGILFTQKSHRGQQSQLESGHFGTILLSLKDLQSSSSTASNTAQKLQVNGQLQVAGTVLLTPSSTPSDPQSGQIFFDKSAKQVKYYDGLQFQTVGSGTTTINNVTNVTNIRNNFLAGTGDGVQLQAASPGKRQVGNFNVSGTGAIGTVQTTTITSAGGTLYINPVGATTQQTVVAGTPATAGLTIIGSTFDGPGFKDWRAGQKITIGSVGGTAKSIAVYYANVTPGDRVVAAIYADDGDIPSKPSSLIVSSSVITMTTSGWQTITIPSTNLTANTTYWLAVNTDSATLTWPFMGNTQIGCGVYAPFGSMPSLFQTEGCWPSNNEMSLYLNYVLGAGTSGALSSASIVVGPTGETLFQNSENSTTAFRVQNAAGTSTIFNIDTVNGRIGIGKTTPAFKLDIAAGDINLSNGRSLRFNGQQVISTNGSGSTVSITNFNSGGKVSVQSDSFVVQDANAGSQKLAIDNTGAATFKNSTDSTTAFRIQNAAGTTTLFTVDTTGLNIYIGNPAGAATPVILVLSNKNTAGDPATGTEGGTYYNSTLKSFRCYRNGFWQNCADIEPQHTFSVYDEFLGGSTSMSRNIGSLGWTASTIGANGTLFQNPTTPAPVADRPGVLQLQTTTTANQGNTFQLGNSTGGSMVMTADNDVKTSVAVGATTGLVLRVGLHNETTTTTQPTSGVWWEADPATSANWRYCYGTGSGATCADSTVAIAANTWVTLEIRLTATGSGTSAATFVINNTPFTVNATTIDTAGRVSPALSCFTTTNTAANCYWDYYQLTGTTSTTR